jgi:hypothetical protein
MAENALCRGLGCMPRENFRNGAMIWLAVDFFPTIFVPGYLASGRTITVNHGVAGAFRKDN